MIERIKLFLEDAAIPIIGGIAGSFIGMGIVAAVRMAPGTSIPAAASAATARGTRFASPRLSSYNHKIK